MTRGQREEARRIVTTSRRSTVWHTGAPWMSGPTEPSRRLTNPVWMAGVLVLCLAGAAFVIGCSSATRPDLTPIVLRFIPDDVDELFTGREPFREDHVFDWEFRTPQDLSWWRPALLEKSFPSTEDYAVLTATRRFPRLFRRVRIEADSIHTLRLVTKGLKYEVVLYWSPPGQAHSRHRRMIALPEEGPGKNLQTYNFNLASHPGWKGHTKEIRLDPTALPKQRFQFRSIAGIKFILVEERLKTVIERAWKVDLRREVRNALVVPPGERIERELVVPEDAEFRFSYGFRAGIIKPHTAEPISFRASIRREGEEPIGLVEGRIDPTLKGSAAPGWKDETIDLTDYAGEQVQLILETEPSPSWEAVYGFPVWANPEVLQRIGRTPYDPDSAGKPGAPEAAPANVMVLSLDSLRADHLSLDGYDRPTSPNIDEWARSAGVSFKNALGEGPPTLSSYVSMLSGLDASNHRVGTGPAPSSLKMLASLLRQAGYTTIAMTGGGQLGPESGLTQGFDRYSYWVGRNDYYAATHTIHRLMEWLDENADRPFFSFFHTFEVRDPFRARDPWASQFGADLEDSPDKFILVEPVKTDKTQGPSPGARLVWPDGTSQNEDALSSEQLASIVSLYDSEIAHVDEALGLLFAKLRELKLERDTLVILTSNHGEALGERGRVGHQQLADEDLRVPLVFVFPRRLEEPRVIAGTARSIDILPTVLDLLGLPPQEGIDGTSLVPLMEGKP